MIIFGNEMIGWLGSFFLAICGLPQAWKSIRDGHSEGVSFWFMMLWLLGEIFVLIYIVPLNSLPLFFNYGGNILLVLIILWYKMRPRKKKVLTDETKSV